MSERASERSINQSRQSDCSYCEQPVKLLLIKLRRFQFNFRTAIFVLFCFVFYKKEHGFWDWGRGEGGGVSDFVLKGAIRYDTITLFIHGISIS